MVDYETIQILAAKLSMPLFIIDPISPHYNDIYGYALVFQATPNLLFEQ